MKKFLYAFGVLVLVGAGFLAGSLYKQTETAKNNPPILKSTTDTDTDVDASSLPSGTVRVTPEKQQIIGVRTGVVEKGPVTHFLRALGRVAPDEKRVYRIVAGTDGWIRETYNNDTGTLVKKGERLASFYSPLFRTTQINYLSVLGSSGDERYDAGRRQALAGSQLATVSIKTYIDALESLGMSKQQMEELARTREVTDKVFIIAPETGFILARNVSPGQQFEKGAEWYRIADLSSVWILADLYGMEARYFRPGLNVKVSLPDQGRSFTARVSSVLPQFDPNTRTLKLRLEAKNPGFFLRPDMFVDVEFPVESPPAITVSADAILDSGFKKTVFVDRGHGYFEPRQVETGWRLGNKVEITKGLTPGERIVTSGTFLIDSESRLELVASGIAGSLTQDPVSGVAVSVRKAEKTGRKSSFQGKTYYFATEENRTRFNQDPGRYAEKQESPEGSLSPTPNSSKR
ncbi:MAG: efflux RND transporter periplasmic adaptor subunit [Deltaproteobacteria bacterium]|nr:efflux RND transporter periplasmic adaptor subunit [Deltaproteobacteria bacterium]